MSSVISLFVYVNLLQPNMTWYTHPYINVNSLGLSDAYMRQYITHHWLRQWLVAWPVPSHYLNRCWYVVNWNLMNKHQWNLNQNSYIFIQENAFENVVCKNGGHFVSAWYDWPACVITLVSGRSVARRWLDAWGTRPSATTKLTWPYMKYQVNMKFNILTETEILTKFSSLVASEVTTSGEATTEIRQSTTFPFQCKLRYTW